MGRIETATGMEDSFDNYIRSFLKMVLQEFLVTDNSYLTKDRQQSLLRIESKINLNESLAEILIQVESELAHFQSLENQEHVRILQLLKERILQHTKQRGFFNDEIITRIEISNVLLQMQNIFERISENQNLAKIINNKSLNIEIHNLAVEIQRQAANLQAMPEGQIYKGIHALSSLSLTFQKEVRQIEGQDSADSLIESLQEIRNNLSRLFELIEAVIEYRKWLDLPPLDF